MLAERRPHRGRHAVRRPAADARHRPRADGGAAADGDRRAVARPRAEGDRSGLRDPAAAAREAKTDVADRRAELDPGDDDRRAHDPVARRLASSSKAMPARCRPTTSCGRPISASRGIEDGGLLSEDCQCPALLKGRGHIDRALPEIAPQRALARAQCVPISVAIRADDVGPSTPPPRTVPAPTPLPIPPPQGGRSVRRRSVITKPWCHGRAVVPRPAGEGARRTGEGEPGNRLLSSRPPHPAWPPSPRRGKGRRPVRAKWRLMHGACRPGETP